jgi:hypothetical protein
MEGLKMNSTVKNITVNLSNLKWWQATAALCLILICSGFAAYMGVSASVNVTVDTRLVLNALNLEVGSSYSLLMRDYSYVIARPLGDNALYCLQNGTTGVLDAYNSNQSKIQTFATGNLTAGGGSIFIKDIAWNTSVSIPNSVIVIESNSGAFTYRTATLTQHIPDCPTNVSATFTLTSDTSEHTIVTLTPTSVEQVTNFYLDMSALTQNCTLRVYITIGAGYVEMTSMTLTVATGTKGLALKDMVINTNWKLTIQSTVAEGASRSIPYEYFVDVY